MNWTRLILAVIASAFASSITDWLFMGILFHDKYMLTPEMWRGKPGQAETRTILGSSLFGLLCCAAFGYLCVITHHVTLHRSLVLAFLVWLIGPLPVIMVNVLWMRFHPHLGISHSLGWLARLVITALIVTWVL